MKIYPKDIGVTWADEVRNCTIRALCNTTGMPYLKAREYLESKGKPRNRGMTVDKLHEALKGVGFSCIGLYGRTYTAKALGSMYSGKEKRVFSSLSLGRAIKLYSKGHYVILLRGHATSLVDGEVIDTHPMGANSSVVAVYERV